MKPFLMHGFRDGAYPLPGQPTQYHLGRGLAMGLTNTSKDRIIENTPTTISQKCPGRGYAPLLGHDLSKWDLLGERMQLYLMDYGSDFAGKNQIDQPVRQEIADSNATNSALLVQIFHALPSPW
nr:hypothetical protein [Bifidobacterium asteroides]